MNPIIPEKGETESDDPKVAGIEPFFEGDQERFHALFDLSASPVTLTTLKARRFIAVNKAFCLITGYTQQEVLGQPFFDLVIPVSHDQERSLPQLTSQNDLEGIETRLRLKNGTIFRVKYSAKVIPWDGHNCILTFIDLDAFPLETHTVPVHRERRYYTILETITETYYEMDLSGRLTFFNHAATELLGYTAEKLLGMSFKTYVSPHEFDKVIKTFNAVFATGEPVRFMEYAMRHKDGTEMLVETSANLLRDGQGNPVGFYGILRDRTAQKKAEVLLRQSEESYRGILELAPDAISVSSILDGRYLEVNDAFYRLSGYSMEEAIGKTPLELNLYVDPLDRKIMQTAIRTLGRVDSREIKVRIKSGQILDTLISARTIRFRGQPCLLTIVTNVTALTQAQKALRQSEAKYRTILEVMEEGYYEVDLKGSYIAFNNSSLRFHGCSASELQGMNFKRFIPPEKVNEVRQLFAEIYRTGASHNILDHAVIRKDGSRIMLEISAYPLKDAVGKTIGFWGISRDRTEQKKAEMALKKSEERYRLLVEHANEGIYITQQGRIRFLNPKMAHITEYSAEELADMAFIDLVHPEDRKLVEQSQSQSISFRIISKREDVVWVELCTVDITWEGQRAYLNFLRDITPQRKMETQLLQAKKMEAMGTLAGGIAHDFNNLLMGIQGNTDLVMLEIEENDPLYERIQCIEVYVRNGINLTRQLLGAAKGGKYEVRPTDLNQLVSTSADLFGRTKKEITIHKRFQEKLETVEVDQGQIAQVLLNLFVNAWQAMPTGGNLYLETHNVQLDEFYTQPYGLAPGRFVKLSVGDTGHGIDPLDQKRIFDPFFTTKGLGGGCGLGLASAYGIITNHGGIINVYSEKGAGATFNIYLPVSEKTVIDQNELKMTIRTGNETVLFVDDEKGIVEIARLILEKLGYTVIEAHSGREAVEIYRQQQKKIGIVILDMIMPGMSGSETFAELREIDSQAKILLSSGYSLTGQAQSIMAQGCNGFIQKPFNMQDLSIKVRQVLDNQAH